MPVVRRDSRAVSQSVYSHVITKFFRMGSLPPFVTPDALLHALLMRELRYDYSVTGWQKMHCSPPYCHEVLFVSEYSNIVQSVQL